MTSSFCQLCFSYRRIKSINNIFLVFSCGLHPNSYVMIFLVSHWRVHFRVALKTSTIYTIIIHLSLSWMWQHLNLTSFCTN
jgi:uncharacterized membrane protein